MGMDMFKKAISVRLRSNRNKYIVALDDEGTVCLTSDGSSENAIWTVEIVKDENFVRLISRYGKYLTATHAPFLPGVTGKQVKQTKPEELNSLCEWEPIRDGWQVRLRARSGTYLRPNGGIPPWRNSVTHDTPHRPGTIEKVLWDVEVVEAAPVEKNPHRRTRSDSILNRSRSVSSLSSSSACNVPKTSKDKDTNFEDFLG